MSLLNAPPNESDIADVERATAATRHLSNKSKANQSDTEISFVLLLEDDSVKPIPSRQKARIAGNKFDSIKASTCIWLVLCLLAVELFVTTVKPLKYLPDKKYHCLEPDAWLAKIPSFFNSDSHVQTLIIGSSLPMFAFSLFDRPCAQSLPEEKAGTLCAYTDTRYFEHLLKQDLGLNGSAKNLTVVGCMVSESYALLKHLVERGRVPEYVIYGIAPRDFIDNQMPPIWQSPVYEALGDFDYLNHRGADFPKGNALTDFALSSISRFYKSRNQYHTVLVDLASAAFGHPISLYAASCQHLPDSKLNSLPDNASCGKIPIASLQAISGGSPYFQDLEEYKHRYLPINLMRFSQEKAYFERLISFCANHHIKMIVVKMPLTTANYALIPRSFKNDYNSFLENSRLHSNFQIVDLCQSHIFTNNDFLDSVHLNESGSHKFQDTLIKAMKVLSIQNFGRANAISAQQFVSNPRQPLATARAHFNGQNS